MSSFDFYFLFYSIYVFHENVRYKANYKKNIISKCPEHSLADLDMHTPLHRNQERNRYILNIIFLLGQRPTMQSIV